MVASSAVVTIGASCRAFTMADAILRDNRSPPYYPIRQWGVPMFLKQSIDTDLIKDIRNLFSGKVIDHLVG